MHYLNVAVLDIVHGILFDINKNSVATLLYSINLLHNDVCSWRSNNIKTFVFGKEQNFRPAGRRGGRKEVTSRQWPSGPLVAAADVTDTSLQWICDRQLRGWCVAVSQG